jgi:zinc protease
VERETAQTAIAIAFPGPARNDPDALALRVFANAIGGLGGALFEDLRSRRSLAYTVSAFPVARRLGGAFAAYIATSPDRAEEARHELIHGIARLAETPLPAPDLERAQRYTIGVRRIQTQTNGAQLDQLAHALMLGRGLDEIRDLEDRVQALTPETIRDAAMRWIDPHRVVSGEVRGIGASR